jgi:dihydrofolate reductase
MRKRVVTENITLDGSIEMLGDWFDPTAQDEEQLAEMHRQGERGDALLLGRQTFEDFRGFWPERTDDTTGVTEELNQVQKYVVSSTMTDAQWQNSTVLAADWLAEVRTLKEQDGQEIGVTGSITLCHALIEAGLVDEYRLFVYPAVQGSGRRLFPDRFEAPRLTLLEARAFPSGVALLRYAPA